MPSRRRSRALSVWLPTALLVAVILGVVFVTIAVQNSWWAEESPVASSDQKASDGSTMLTDAGFDYANVEGFVRVRVGEGALTATELGMGTDAEKTADLLRPLRAVIAGGDEVQVVDDVIRVAAVSRNDMLTSVTLGLDGASAWSDALAKMSALAPSMGWDPAQIAAFEGELAAFNRAADGDTFTAVIGPSSGDLRATGTLSFDRQSGLTQTSITFEP